MTDPHATPPGQSPPFQPSEQQSPAQKRRFDSSAQGATSWVFRVIAGAAILGVIVLAALLLTV